MSRTSVSAKAALRTAAARRALTRQLQAARRGRSMLHPLIGRHAHFEAWEHYPRKDVIDISGRWQFYYHAHAPHVPDHVPIHGEHGHLHLFRRRENPGERAQLSHVAALALDARGTPLCWFATNRWVTGDHWQGAERLARHIEKIEIPLQGPLRGIAQWLGDLVRFYADDLRHMLRARDAALQTHQRQYRMTRQQALEDRRVAIWSSVAVGWPQDALTLAAEPSTRAGTVPPFH